MPREHDTDTDTESSSPAPVDLRVDARPGIRRTGDRLVPVVSRRHPRLSWWIPLVREGQRQTGWEIEFQTRSADRAEERFTGTSGTPFAVLPRLLDSSTRYRFRVRTRDEQESWSAWSASCSFESGPFEYREWHAHWVSQPALEIRRTGFDWSGEVSCARIRFAAQGLTRIQLNGEPVNADATDPSRSDIVRALYRSYDVTDLVRTGTNALDITLAPGAWEKTGLPPRVLAEIVVESPDGRRSTWAASTARAAAASEVDRAEPFYLERHDARRVPDFHAVPAAEAVPVSDLPTSPADAPTRVLADPSEPIRDVQSSTPQEIARIDGIRVFDVGVNIAGRAEVTVHSPDAGERIRLVHGEHLGASGRVDTTSLTLPFDNGRERQVTEFELTGSGGQRCTPWFSYQGFRYVEVAGLREEAEIAVTVHTHHTDLRTTTELRTDSPLIDRLMQRAERTLLNNVHGIPEDCPTREQAGWTGDTASVTEMEFAAFGMEAFFRKWLGDLRTSQRPDGAIPAIAPQVGGTPPPPDPVWGAALQRVLIGHWHHYGDRAVVDENLPALRRWADYQWGCRGPDGVIDEASISYGHDWLALEQTPPPVHHTGATIDCLVVLAELEALVGDEDRARARRGQADELRAAARRVFYDAETGVVANGSQGSYAVAIESGMVTGADASRALERLIADIRDRGDRVSSGFATTRTVVRALARHGRSQVVLDVLKQPAEPGVGAMLDHGPGTFWECWWIDPANTGTGSLDHIGLGGPFAGWALQFLAGVRPTAGGFARWELAPQFIEGVDRLRMTTETINGPLEVRYERDGDRIDLAVTVPVGTEATLAVSGVTSRILPAGRHRIMVPRPYAGPPRIAARIGNDEAWAPPSVAPVPGDVVGGESWLAAAIADRRIHQRHSAMTELADGIICMPVPHAQPPGPVLRVVGDPESQGTAPSVRLEFASPQDLDDARFVYAMLDLCLENTTRAIESVLTVHAADGSSSRATGRLWPAGWNRVAVDLRAWSGRDAVVAVEVGLGYTDAAPADTSVRPAAFHLGPVGSSTAKRTW